MKKLFKSLIALTLCLSMLLGMSTFVSAEEKITVLLDGKELVFSDQLPILVEDRTLVPMRAIFEAMGAVVFWDKYDDSVVAVKDTDMVELGIGKTEAKKNAQSVTLDVPAQLINDRTMVPLRFVGEALGAQVDWLGDTNTVDIKTTQKPAVETKTNEEKLAALPEGEVLVNSETVLAANISGGAMVKKETVSVSGMPFDTALRVQTVTEPNNVYNVQMTLRMKQAVKKDDILLCMFYVRGVETSAADGSAQLSVVHEELASGKYDKTMSQGLTLEPGAEWIRVFIPYTAIRDMAADKSQVNIRFGYPPQTVEIADFQVINYKNSVEFTDLPVMAATYPGQEADAQWRKDAWARIEQNRKSDFDIQVVGENGAPVSGAKVNVALQKHDFDFGTAVNKAFLDETNERGRLLSKYLRLFFNAAVPENELKRPAWASSQDTAKRSVNKLLSYDFDVRGHTMVWDRWDKLPPAFETDYAINDPKRMETETLAHISEIGSAFSGYLREWDVANEILQNNKMRGILGDETLVKWYQEAKKADPHAILYLNENTVGTTYNTQAKKFEELLKKLKGMGAPIEAVGFQCHYNAAFDPQKFIELSDVFAPLVDELKITEFDYNCTDEQLQADFTRDMIIAAYSHPSYSGFMMWGFYDGAHWLKNAPLFHEDWTLKPSGAAYIDLVYNQLWTNEDAVTDAKGTSTVRGYQGEYIVTVEYNGKTYQQRADLTKDGTNKLVFDVSAQPVPLADKPVRQIP